MRRILLTRSEEENKKIASRLDGFEVISCPMLFYKNLDVDWQEFKPYSHLIITSKYAAKLVAENYPFNVTAYVVGSESAGLLAQNPNVTLGGIFDNVEDLLSRHPEGEVYLDRRDLVTGDEELEQAHVIPPKIPTVGSVSLSLDDGVLYLSGDHITQDIPFSDRKVIYNTEYANSLDANLLKKEVDYVLIFSRNSANNLIKLLGHHNLLQKIENSVTIALSKKLADQMKDYVAETQYPEQPIADNMIKLLIEYERNFESA